MATSDETEAGSSSTVAIRSITANGPTAASDETAIGSSLTIASHAIIANGPTT